MNQTIVAKSAGASVINWAQIAGLIAMGAAYFGLPVTVEQLLAIFADIQAVVAIITIIRRTFFNYTLPPQFAGQTVTVVKS